MKRQSILFMVPFFVLSLSQNALADTNVHSYVGLIHSEFLTSRCDYSFIDSNDVRIDDPCNEDIAKKVSQLDGLIIEILNEYALKGPSLNFSSKRKQFLDIFFNTLPKETFISYYFRNISGAFVTIFPDLDYYEMKNYLSKSLISQGVNNNSKLLNILLSKSQMPEECPTFSLLNERTLNGPLRVTDQGDANTCYIHTAVKAIDYLNYSTNHASSQTSIISTGILYNTSPHGSYVSDIDWGKSAQVVDWLQLNGGCRIEPLETNDKKIQVDLQILFSQLQGSFQSIKHLIPKDGFYILPEHPTSKDLKKFASVNNPFLFALKQEREKWAPFTEETYKKALLNIQEYRQFDPKQNPLVVLGNSFLVFINELIKGPTASLSFAGLIYKMAFCLDDNKLTYPKTRVVSLGNFYKSRETLNNYFHTKNPQPIMVSLPAEVLVDPKPNTYSQRFTHAVLITGQKYDNRLKQCAYQILNSWGDSGHYTGFESHPENRGIFWVPEKVLSYGTTMEYLELRK